MTSNTPTPTPARPALDAMAGKWRPDEIDDVENRIRSGIIQSSGREYSLLMDALEALRTPSRAHLLRSLADMRGALEKAEAALDLYGNEEHWQGDTFRPVRLEAGCRCLSCYEAFSDKGAVAREACTDVESALARSAP